MKSTASTLSDKSMVIVFTYAPAGLGHLRVTDALYSGLPHEVSPLLLGSQDKGIEALHRFLSINMYLRRLFEWGQTNPQQGWVTAIYRYFLRQPNKLIYRQMRTLLDQRIDTPSTVLLIATHYGLAHKLAVVKKQLEEEKNVKVILVVQVTDDSPQYIWYVENADLTFVPSQYTKNTLEAYGKQEGLTPLNMEVVAYPVSPFLAEALPEPSMFEKYHQVDPSSKTQIHMCIPVSGAAVGLSFSTKLIDTLYTNSHRYMFHVVTRSAPYTLPFLNEMLQRPFVKLYVSAHDREVVNAYEDLYAKYKISLEVTKPSEQSFKTLLKPSQRGGAILLFSEPVGRQEYDNINFMRRHNLIPDKAVQRKLWAYSERAEKIPSEQLREVRKQAVQWRGLELPKDPVCAAHYISWCLDSGLFKAMMQNKGAFISDPDHSKEISPFGVRDFWHMIADFLNKV